MKNLLMTTCQVLIYCFILLCLPLYTYTQQYNCGSHESLIEENNDPDVLRRRQLIETHTKAQLLNGRHASLSDDIITIPIVFHVIHNGSAIGAGNNIDDSYILAQLQQLNDDFRRQNVDADNTWQQASDTNIEFCLAQYDPNGNPTSGIVRHQFDGSSWSKGAFNAFVKPSTVWNRDNYLNFWIVNLSGSLLGYAQFPGGYAPTDGIVCKTSTIGSLALPNPIDNNYKYGRVATHEAGHWLNLRHIWGDNPCGFDDFVLDTPESDNPNYQCDLGHVSCNSEDMIQNYMDYSYDACKNLFTTGQKNRMHAIFSPGGSRESLVNSLACYNTEIANCNIVDWLVLKKLYDQTNGESWTNTTGWDDHIANLSSPLTTCDLSDLYGISLDETGRVNCIDMDGIDNCAVSLSSGNGLSGAIPSELGNLIGLSTLSLSNNQLTGNIPEQLANLINLSSLSLNDNELEGCYSFELNNICDLDIANNNNISRNNNFDHPWEDFCDNRTGICDSLIYIDCVIDPSVYSGREIDSISLLVFYYSTNGEAWYRPWNLNQSMDTWNGIELNEEGRVIALKLGGNNVAGTLPCHLGNLSELKDLDIGSNYLFGNLPAEIGQLANLETMWLIKNQLENNIPTEFGNLSKLKIMGFKQNQLSGSLPQEIGGLTNLEYLDLQRNELSGTLPIELGQLNRLEKLFLQRNNFEGNIPIELSNLGNLISLNLGYNQISGTIPIQIGDITSLESLYLNDNDLSGTLPTELGQLTNLTTIWLQKNKFTGSIPSELGSFSNLTYSFNLSWNQLTGSIPPELGNFDKLLNGLNLSYNQLTGSIPPELGQLVSSISLKLHHNQLSGNIPAELGQMNSVSHMLLYNNNLTGTIPSTFSQLANLIQLRIEINDLSGCFSPVLNSLCSTLNSASNINQGNNFDAPWEDFCANGDGTCESSGNVCNLNDWNALKAFYESTNGDTWVDRTGWDIHIDNKTEPTTDCDLSALFGVTVNGAGRVICIDLDGTANCDFGGSSGNGLTGTLPSELGNLSYLEYLNLNNNDITGNIPPEIGNLARLKKLKLISNSLSGSIPIQLGNLNSLTHLYFGYNNLTGNIPPELGDLTNLEYLNLNGYLLSGSIPPELGNLSQLIDLSFYGNNLSGSIPAELGNLSLLEKIDLSSNNLSGSIPSELGNLNKLDYLRLSNNNLTGSIPASLGDLTKLGYLQLFNNDLSGCFDENLLNWCLSPQLDWLKNTHISNGNNFDSTWEDFCNNEEGACESTGNCNLVDWTALKALYDSTNGDNWKNRTGWDLYIANQTSPSANCDLSALFGVSLNNEDRVICVDLDGTANCDFSGSPGNGLTGTLPSELGNLSYLEYLNLNNNDISGDIPIELGNLASLTTLKLIGNNLTGTIPTQLSQLTQLTHLYLGFNLLSGSIPPELGNLINLEYLNLNGYYLSGSIPSELGNLNKLIDLSLYGNKLSGSIPTELVNLTNIEQIDLSSNNLTGSIPAEFGDLINLGYLRISKNNLTGSIPPELANLTNLWYLQLNDNDLSGCYNSNLTNWCNSFDWIRNANISIGNNFDSAWEDFCNNGEGACNNCTQDIMYTSPIVGGTNNHAKTITIATDVGYFPGDINLSASDFIYLNIGTHIFSGNNVNLDIRQCEE